MKTSTCISISHRWWLCFLAFALVIVAAPVARAGLTVSINLYHTQYGYYAYGFLNATATAPDFPDGNYLIASPDYPGGGSSLLYSASGGSISQGIDGQYGTGNYYPDFDALLQGLTNGNWSIWVTNGVTTQYQFHVTISGLSSNSFGLPALVTYPVNNASNIPDQPTFTWTGPANWLGSLYVDVNFIDGGYSYVDSASLPTSATSWTPAVTLPAGMNSFSASYDSNITALVSTTVPTNGAGQVISGWTNTANLNTRGWSDFSVAGGGFNESLVARYNFENPGFAGRDSSGNNNDANCSSSSGPLEDTASTDAAVGTYAREFQGDTGICFTDGGSAFPNLSNALSGSFTVTAWVKTTAAVGSDDDDAKYGLPILFTENNGPNSTTPLSITDTKAAFTVRDDNGDPVTLHSSTTVNDGSYYFLAVTRDAATGDLELYVDGNLEAADIGSTEQLNAGTYLDLAGGNSFYNGLLDDVRIYSTNLTAEDIASLAGHPPGTSLADALDTTGLVWTTGGDANWFAESTETHDGSDAAQSGAIGNDESSWVETTVTGPGTLTFWWKVDSDDQDGYDYLEFVVDGNGSSISGDSGWEWYETHLDAGPQTLRWTYYKDSDYSAGADAGFLDEVSFVPDTPPTITFQPVDLTNYSGYPATLVADAAAIPEADWQWYKVGTGFIPGANSRFYNVANSGTVGVAGSYYAIADNGAGSAYTRTAVVSYVSAPLPPDWSKAFGTQLTGNFTEQRTNYGIASLVDASGNVYSANSFTGTNGYTTNTFISGPGRFGSGLFKSSATGTALWGRALTNNGSGNSFPQCLARAPGDGVYMSGVFLGTNHIGTNILKETAGGSLYLIRFDSAGTVLWVRTFGGTNSQSQSYHQLVADPDGNVTIAAFGNNLVNFGTTNIILDGQQGVLAQYDANGNLRWVATPSGSVQYMTYASGRIYAAMDGHETNAIGGISNTSDRRFVLAALNATNGQAFWLQGVGSSLSDGPPSGVPGAEIPAVAVSGSDLFLTGTGWGSNSVFGAFSVSWPAGNGQYFARYDTNGNAQLATTFGGTNTWPWAAVADASGNVYVTGDFDGYATFGNIVIGGPRLGGIGDAFRGQMFLAKFDRNGNSLWVRQGQSTDSGSYVNVRDLSLASDGVWACGFVNYSANFGTNLANRVYGPVVFFGFPFGYAYYFVGGYLAKVTESGLIAPMPVTLLNPANSGPNFQFQFLSQSGFTHSILYRTNLAVGNWKTNSTVTGNGGMTNIALPFSLFSPAQQGFIRVSTQ